MLPGLGSRFPAILNTPGGWSQEVEQSTSQRGRVNQETFSCACSPAMMKKGGLNFLNRKNRSLFDTSVPMKEIDNVEFVYNSVVIPDSGTANVRSRPTVKHFSTFGDGAGFAVPTPTVPVLSSSTTPQISHTDNTDSRSSGGAISVDDLEEGQILIPPPPSIAPPPPPSPPPPQFIPPSPGHVSPSSGFFGEPFSPVDLSTLEPPSMPPPKPPSLGTPENVDLSVLRPPPMAPPKPPSYQIYSNSPDGIPECPKFTPPLPPTEKPQSPKVQKMPPRKPIRFSSISNLDLPSSGSNTPTSTPSGRPASSFNFQNTGNLYTVPKPKIITGLSDTERITQQALLLENSSRNPAGVHANGKAPISEKEMSTPQSLVPLVKPVRRNSSGMKLENDLQDLKVNVQATLPNQPATPVSVITSMSATVETPPDVTNKILTPIKGSPSAERPAAVLSAKDLINLTPLDPTRKYSPLLNRKLQNLKTMNNEPSSGKEAAASPLALLMAAKEREKQRTTISRENSNSSADYSTGSIHPSDTSPNSFTVTPRPPVSSGSVSPFMEPKPNTENPKVAYSRPEPAVPSSSILMKKPTSIASPTSTSGQYNGFDTISFIPPPPEFANSDPEDEAPPNITPPHPPTKRTDVIPPLNFTPLTNGPTNTPSIKSSSTTTPINAIPITQFKPKPQAPPPSQPKTQTQAPPPSLPKTQPKAPPPSQPKTQTQAPPPSQPKTQTQAPPSVTASQTTLLSILQKKMLEMDPKFPLAHEGDTGSDEWNSPHEDVDGGPSLNSTPKPKHSTFPAQSAGLDMKELENKVTKKTQAKAPASTGSSKQQFGMTFMVRPGTKQPITPVPKTE